MTAGGQKHVLHVPGEVWGIQKITSQIYQTPLTLDKLLNAKWDVVLLLNSETVFLIFPPLHCSSHCQQAGLPQYSCTFDRVQQVGSDGPTVALWVNPDQLAAIILSASVYKLSFLSEPSA
jgi:hypothetical protein